MFASSSLDPDDRAWDPPNFVFSCSFSPWGVFRKHWRTVFFTQASLIAIGDFKQIQGVAGCAVVAPAECSGPGCCLNH
jgi:hypothetical protein